MLLQVPSKSILVQARRKAEATTGNYHVVRVQVMAGRQRTEPNTLAVRKVFFNKG